MPGDCRCAVPQRQVRKNMNQTHPLRLRCPSRCISRRWSAWLRRQRCCLVSWKPLSSPCDTTVLGCDTTSDIVLSGDTTGQRAQRPATCSVPSVSCAPQLHFIFPRWRLIALVLNDLSLRERFLGVLGLPALHEVPHLITKLNSGRVPAPLLWVVGVV